MSSVNLIPFYFLPSFPNAQENKLEISSHDKCEYCGTCQIKLKPEACWEAQLRKVYVWNLSSSVLEIPQ